MMSFPSLIMNRELGLPRAQLKIEEAIDQAIADHMVKDCFHFETIELPKSSDHRTFRCQNIVAVLSVNKIGEKVQRLALWSLITKRKVWELETIHNYMGPAPGSCSLSEYGMVLVDNPLTEDKIIVLNGKQSGVLPKHNWHSVVPIGLRILGCWRLDSSNICFGEFDQTGKSLYCHQLDNTNDRVGLVYACDKNYWVRLSGGFVQNLVPIIEIVDRVIGNMKTVKLPHVSGIEIKFTSACIVQNRLIYGTTSNRDFGGDCFLFDYKPKICIFDLDRGVVVDEFPTGAEFGVPKKLVATQNYAAWLEGNNVKYLDIFNRTIKVATTRPYCEDDSEVVLNIVGNILSVTCCKGYWFTGSGSWQRKVVDMTNGEIKRDISYKRHWSGQCSLANGNLLFTDGFTSQPSMYIESFIGDGAESEKSNFRING